MGRKPRTSAPIVPQPARVTSRKHARRLTTAYHDITHRLAAAANDTERARCEAELESMGGVAAYQAASVLNTALNPVSRWVKRSLAKGRAKGSPPSILEIGAVNTQLLDAKDLNVRAIDLHTADSRIEQCDFFSLAHGGQLDAESGGFKLYDAIVCSMVLNCVPHPRRRFEMLVGMRSMLKAGGKAFVTLPRSCLDHSFTLCEDSFCDVLAAVGLRRLDGLDPERTPDADGPGGSSGPGGSRMAPSSSKIVYFECIAEAPSAEAAVRVQRARHEARASQRAANSNLRAKSAGAAFDVDVGGSLGFGVRVARSYDAPDSGRRAKEQLLVRAEFLRRQGESAGEAGAKAPVASSAAGPADDEVGDNIEQSSMSMAEKAGLAAIEQQLEIAAQSGSAQLDYAQWRWYPDAATVDGLPCWRASGGTGAGSAQARSGWHWSAAGWVQSPASNDPASQQAKTITDEHPASSAPSKRDRSEEVHTRRHPAAAAAAAEGDGGLDVESEREARLRRKKRRILEARVSSVGGRWWRRFA